MDNPPCKDCEKRHVGCHSDCNNYKKFREYMNDKNDKIRKEKTYMVTQTKKKYLEKRGQR